MNNQIVIVGAGIAGLTAGYYLKKVGYHPIVLEKSSRVGGRMISEVVDGFTIDCGAQFLMDSYPLMNSLIEENNLSSKLILTSQYMGTMGNGKIRRTDRGNVLSLLRSGLLIFPGWLRFIMRSLQIMMNTRSLPMNDFTVWKKYDNQDTEV